MENVDNSFPRGKVFPFFGRRPVLWEKQSCFFSGACPSKTKLVDRCLQRRVSPEVFVLLLFFLPFLIFKKESKRRDLEMLLFEKHPVLCAAASFAVWKTAGSGIVSWAQRCEGGFVFCFSGVFANLAFAFLLRFFDFCRVSLAVSFL